MENRELLSFYLFVSLVAYLGFNRQASLIKRGGDSRYRHHFNVFTGWSKL
ncbi:hypothetical protein [Thaumasiovibrio sp. DFM-14]